MPPVSRFPDVEAELVGWLTTHLPAITFSTETDAELQDQLPACRLYRIGGADSDYRLDHPLIDCDTFAANREAAHDAAHDVHDCLRFSLAGQIAGGMVVGQVRTIQGPRWTPYDNTTVRRFVATYQLTTHSL